MNSRHEPELVGNDNNNDNNNHSNNNINNNKVTIMIILVKSKSYLDQLGTDYNISIVQKSAGNSTHFEESTVCLKCITSVFSKTFGHIGKSKNFEKNCLKSLL